MLQGPRLAAYITYSNPSKTFRHQFSHPPSIGGSQVKVERVYIGLSRIESPIDPKIKYDPLTVLHCDDLDFGTRLSDDSMMLMNSIQSTGKNGNVFLTLDLKRKEILVNFPLTVGAEVRSYRFEMPVSQLGSIYQLTVRKDGKMEFVIPFDTPPRFLMRTNDLKKTFSTSDRIWAEHVSWYRQTDVVDRLTQMRMNGEPVKNHQGTAIIDIGRWTTYRLVFTPSSFNMERWATIKRALSDHGIKFTARPDFTFHLKQQAPIWKLLQDEFSVFQVEENTNTSAFDDLSATRCSLKFSVRYQLEVCVSNGFLKEHSITAEFLERLAAMDPTHAKYVLEKIADRQQVFHNPNHIFGLPVKNMVRRIPEYCTLAHSVTITPTMLYVNTPVVETSNRITRKHSADADRFIRVKFAGEKTEGRVSSYGDDRSDAVFVRIARAMKEGIVIAGRHYVFLAFGNSQFRENGAYFYAPTSSVSADNIRSMMGCFDHIKTIAKYGARLGQCLSTTRSINHVYGLNAEEIPDVTRNGFTFTDGVGKISGFLAQMAGKELGIHNAWDDTLSLFQYRMDGCKGVLALDPALKSKIVQIRPSQRKFETRKKGNLEIIRASSFATSCLNRQLIVVLSTLGVTDECFITKQQAMLESLERATKEEDVAIEKLQRNIDLNQTSLTMAGMVIDGFMKAQEPFMMSLLRLWQAYNIKYLKEKARIMIEDGALLLGCVDETATLRGHFDEPQSRPGATRAEKMTTLPEIFLQVSTGTGHYQIIQDVCILARNPSLHAGDIRVVRAVDVPALHHMKNVVVLPQTGDRDIANMCSGGDLDGDDYIVIWDKDFIPKVINEVPMDFTPEKPKELDRPVTIHDICDFFVTYMKNDSLARIALAHLAQADYHEDGVNSEKCLQLAQLHSQAVDYPKSGIPAIMDRDLTPMKWPHFMENKYRPKEKIYRSKKILGQLFDQVQLVDFKPHENYEFDKRILDAYNLDQSSMTDAVSIKEQYDASLKRLMAKHAIRTEFEAWSVFVLSHNQESRDYTFAEDFGRSMEILKSEYRELCKMAAKEDMLRFVAAMYTVTAQEFKVPAKAKEKDEEPLVELGSNSGEDGEPEVPLMSFPWLFPSQLGKIATMDHTQELSITEN